MTKEESLLEAKRLFADEEFMKGVNPSVVNKGNLSVLEIDTEKFLESSDKVVEWLGKV